MQPAAVVEDAASPGALAGVQSVLAAIRVWHGLALVGVVEIATEEGEAAEEASCSWVVCVWPGFQEDDLGFVCALA